MDKIRRKEIFILILCFIVGFALRFYTFDQKSLWTDEVYTFNDSRDGLKDQMKFYKENPTFLHPPLFFILTHLFYPFPKPERDLRIIPLIFGTLSIPMFYFLAKLFSPTIALPCTLSLTFMTYHLSLSQDGRSYSMLMFLGMAGLYFFMKYLITLKKIYLPIVAFLFSILFYTNYTSVLFIALSQMLLFYRANGEDKTRPLSSFLIFIGLILLFCLPWIIFLASNYKDQMLMDPHHTEDPGSLWTILYGVVHDWSPHAPLMIVSVVLLILFPLFSKNRRNAILLLSIFILPIVGVYLFCKMLNITHFVTSRYFINFLPIFFISLYLSLQAIEVKFEGIKRSVRLKIFFLFLFIISNLVILPLYYRSEKQDFRGLANYLKQQLREEDKIFDGPGMYTPGILHYFGTYPKGRHYIASFSKEMGVEIGYRISFFYLKKIFTIYHSKDCCVRYVEDGSRLWIVVDKNDARKIKKDPSFILKGYFDGSFLNFNRFPTDASMYLFLLDPKSSDEKGIDMPIE